MRYSDSGEKFFMVNEAKICVNESEDAKLAL